MIKCEQLNCNTSYKIEGESGTWYYSHQIPKNREIKYFFWREAVKNTRKITINLSRMQVQRKVTEDRKVQPSVTIT